MSKPRVAFIHAHPDDEAIFTGGTIALLIDAGIEVLVIIATGGELGDSISGDAPLDAHRRQETLASCLALGLDAEDQVRFLQYEDSGVDGENPQGLVHQDLGEVARRIMVSIDGPVDAIVGYDRLGIYGHPDHIAVHDAVAVACEYHLVEHGAAVTQYQATVDREYLHFVETHLVVEAGHGERPVGRGLASTNLGLSTLEIDTAIEVVPVLERKRAAMRAHQSQLPADAPLFELGQANFAAVYGWEWYRRVGPMGLLDELSNSPHR